MKHLLVGSIILTLILTPLFAAKIPREAPDLQFQLPSGTEMSLSHFKGKVIALEFLLTTCPHCKRTSAAMQKLYAEYAGKGFQAIGVAFNAPAPSGADVGAYASEVKVTYPIGSAHRDRVVDFLQHPLMLTMWTPQIVFIDQAGNIVAQYDGMSPFFKNEEENMRAMIDKLLGN